MEHIRLMQPVENRENMDIDHRISEFIPTLTLSHRLETTIPSPFPYLTLLTDGEELSPHKDVQNHRLHQNATISMGGKGGLTVSRNAIKIMLPMHIRMTVNSMRVCFALEDDSPFPLSSMVVIALRSFGSAPGTTSGLS